METAHQILQNKASCQLRSTTQFTHEANQNMRCTCWQEGKSSEPVTRMPAGGEVYGGATRNVPRLVNAKAPSMTMIHPATAAYSFLCTLIWCRAASGLCRSLAGRII